MFDYTAELAGTRGIYQSMLLTIDDIKLYQSL